MSQKNEILPLLLTVMVTSALLGGIAWWLLNKTFPNLNDRSNSSSSNNQISETLGAVTNVPEGLFNYGGSTTWAPIRKEVDFIIQQVWPKFRLVYTDPTTGTPGTGSGIRMLIENQLAFSQASRSLKDEEIQRAQQRGLTLKEVPVAIDGIAIAVHPDLPVSGLTITQLKDIYTGSGSSVNVFTQLASINNKIYFNATTNSNGNELWVTDGTNAGTTLVKDIYLGTLNSNIEKLTSINNYLLFSANDGNRLYNTLWKSDGTPNGTFELKDTNLTQNSDMDLRFVEFNGEVFFPSGYNSSNGVELWKTDGTSTNTNLFEDIFHRYSGVYDFFDSAEINGKLIISGNNGNGKEPFVTDGTVNGTFIIKDINPGSSASIFSSSDFRPASYTKAGNYVFFRAASSNIGFELWKTDGTQTNTSLVKDIKSGSGSSLSEFTFFAELNGILYFKADDGIHGEELWRSDGTNEGTYLVKDINPGSAPSLNGISNVYYNEPNILNEKCFAILNGFLYFTAKDGIDNSIWKTDGTENGTIKVITIQQSGGYDNNRIIINATNNKIFFKTNTTNSSYGNNSLWSSDGTQAGTIHLYHTDITGPIQFKKNIIHDDNLYFSVYDSNGLTLIKSDGTVGGTIVIKDNLSFSPNMNIKSLISCGGNVYFSIGEQGSIDAKELWRTDGSTFGTLKLGDLTNSSSIFENFNYCNTCYQENLIFNKTSINNQQ